MTVVDTAPIRMTAAQLADLLKVGPHGYEHGWVFVGIPGGGGRVSHPELGGGQVTGVGNGKVRVRFDNGTEHSFEHKAGPARGGGGPGHFEPRGGSSSMPSPATSRPGEVSLLDPSRPGTPAPGVRAVDRLNLITGGKRKERAAVADLTDEELRGADQEFARRATLLGRGGQVSSTHQLVRDAIAHRSSANG